MLNPILYTDRTLANRFNEKQRQEMTAWVQDLAPWSVIAHHTFEWAASVWSAQKSYEKFMKRELRDVSYFYAVEQNPSRDGHHVHALWSDCAGVQRSEIWKRWFERFGRNKIEPVRSTVDVADYCAKYVTKEGAWWNVKILRGGDLPFAAGPCGARPARRSSGSALS